MKNLANIIVTSLFVVVIFIALSSPFVSAANFVKGKHYNELSTPIKTNGNSDKEVREFFSYYCPGCYRLEPIINELKAKLPAGVPLIKNHVDGMPGRDIAIEQALSKALVTAKLLKVEDKITEVIFNYIHVNKATFSNDKDIKNLFILHGIDESRFDKVFNSFKVKTGVNRMKKSTAALRDQGISRVPTVIVNGRYIVETGAIKSIEEYVELVLYLLER